MDPSTDPAFDAAEARGRELVAREARAIAANYDPATGRVVVELDSGCVYGFPAHLVQDLQGAQAADLADVRVDGLGFNLHWPTLDVDLYVPALVSGRFGTRDWMMRAAARQAGRSASASKAAAARANGGRPRKRA